ncbi:LOW QUALITY PROTEIN: NACHT and WD repeat domain-containing protein 2-like [Saccoglossus kowalevskii]
MVDMIVRTAKSNRLSTADELTQEISHHTLLTHQYTSSCMVGMDEFKKKVLSYFGSHSPIDKYDKNKPLILYGKQGCGLTTFMANLVKQMWGNSSNAVVVVRYLATSPRSETSLSVLRSISLQIARAFGSNVAENQNYDLHNLCDAFEVCLRLAEREKPLWIFLHSLHKIEPVSLDNILLWLRRAFPNRNIRMVISAVRTPKLQHLLKSFIPERNVLEIPSLCKEEVSSIFHTWLQDAGRTLTPEQEQGILKVLNKRCEPLYLRCILHECCTWKSFDGPKDIPSTEITSLFEYSLNTYSSKQVEERALTYLTASKNGLTDNEIVDLLLCDETLEMYPKEQKDIRWPTGIWVELRNLLDVYIQDTSLGDGSITWRWSHDAFREVAEQRFLPSEEIRISIHAYMSSYFDGSLGKTSEQTHRKNPHLDPGIIKHPIILTPAASGDDALTRKIIYNQRRLMELPWALINCGDWQSLEETLCDFKFIQAMCATGQVDVLKTWLEKASNMAIDYDYDPSTLLEFKYLISRDGHILRREPTLLTQQAANYPSLSAPCRWAKKTAEKKANSKTRPLPWLQLINKETVHNSEKSQIRAMHLNMKCALATKICLSPCGMKLGYICQEKGKSVLKCTSTSSGNSYFSYYSVEGDTIKSFCFSKDGTRIAIGMSSSALKILDTKRGRTVKELKDDSTVVQGACIDHVVFSGDDRLVIAAYNSQKRTGCRALCIWDMNSDRGNHLYSNEAEEGCYPHYGNITFLATSPDSDLLASVCDHGVLRIWDLRNGECLCGVNCDSMEEQTNNARHSKCFNSLSFNSKSDCLAVTFTRGIVKIYDTTRSRNCLPVLVTLHHSAKSKLVAAHYHHKLPAILFSCCDKGVVKMWNVNSVELLATTSIPAGGSVKGFVSSSHGPFVCVLADRGMAHLWNAAVEETSPVTSDPVTHVTFSPDGKLVAMVHSQSNLLKIFNHRVTKAEHFLKLQVARPTSCAFSSNGDSLIAVGRTGAQICDIASGRLSPEITELFQGAVLSAVFGSNNNTICALGKDTRVTHTNNGFVRIFHGETRKLVYEFTKMVADDGGQLKVTEDGSTLACFGLDETGKEQRLLFLDADEGEFIHELAVSQTANMFAVNGGFTFAAVCDPEGKSGPTIQLWDVVQQMVVAEYLPYYNADITSISMTTDARYLLSAAKDVVHVCEIFLDDDTNGRKQKLPKISIRRQWTADTTNATTRHKIPITKNQLKCPGSSQQLPGDICDVGLFFTPTKSNITTVCTRPTIQHNPSLRIVVGDEGGNGHALELVQ